MLHVTRLESRDNPAPLIPGWDGAEQHVLGHFNHDAELDTAAIALEGGSCRIMVFDGNGRAVQGEVLLNEIVFDPNFRGGGYAKVIESGIRGVPDHLLAVPGVGGGPHVAQFDFDSGTGRMLLSTSFFAPYPESFRGGLRISSGDIDRDGIPEALFLPGVGGGPHLAAVDIRTHETEFNLYVGDPEDTSGRARFEATGGTALTHVGQAIVIQYGDAVGDWAETRLFPY